MTPAERAEYEGRVKRLHDLADRDRRLIAAGQAAIDWARDTGKCHFCGYYDPKIAIETVVDGDGREIAETPHDDECPLKGLET